MDSKFIKIYYLLSFSKIFFLYFYMIFGFHLPITFKVDRALNTKNHNNDSIRICQSLSKLKTAGLMVILTLTIFSFRLTASWNFINKNNINEQFLNTGGGTVVAVALSK